MSATRQTDVFVVGGGPVGMFTALCLAEAGLRVVIADKYGRTALHSYALALHSHTLRLLDEFGLTAELLERGQVLDHIVLHHDGTSHEIDLGKLGGVYPHVLVLPQAVLEAALEQRLADNGVRILWNHQMLTFDLDSRGALALVAELPEDPDGSSDVETSRVRATFLVGADGYDSPTRRLMGVDHATTGEPITLGLMEFDAPLDRSETMHLVLAPRSTDVLWPLGPDRGRWSVQLPNAVEATDAVRLKKVVTTRAPWFGDDFGTIDWVTTVRFEPRMARRFGRGPVWFVGDAAHFTSPIGVQSMNVGFREGHDLARRLAGILRDGRSPRLLDYFNEERMREWKMLLGVKDRVQVSPETPAWARDRADRLVSTLPATGHDLNLLLEQIGLRLYWLRRRQHG